MASLCDSAMVRTDPPTLTSWAYEWRRCATRRWCGPIPPTLTSWAYGWRRYATRRWCEPIPQLLRVGLTGCGRYANQIVKEREKRLLLLTFRIAIWRG